jgi:hypothetical protein
MEFMTFSKYLERRDSAVSFVPDSPPAVIDGGAATSEELTRGDHAADPGSGDIGIHRQGYVSERSLFRGVFKAVNPSRPASPTSSRLLASPFRRKFRS